MTDPIKANNINDFSPQDQEHIRTFINSDYAKSKAWRDETAIMLPSGVCVTCKSLLALVLDDVEVQA